MGLQDQLLGWGAKIPDFGHARIVGGDAVNHLLLACAGASIGEGRDLPGKGDADRAVGIVIADTAANIHAKNCP